MASKENKLGALEELVRHGKRNKLQKWKSPFLEKTQRGKKAAPAQEEQAEVASKKQLVKVQAGGRQSIVFQQMQHYDDHDPDAISISVIYLHDVYQRRGHKLTSVLDRNRNDYFDKQLLKNNPKY